MLSRWWESGQQEEVVDLEEKMQDFQLGHVRFEIFEYTE
jgi:hypothetical protein